MGAHQLDQTGAALDVAGGERLQWARHARGDRLRGEPDIGGTHDLTLTHGNAALNLGEIFADPDLDEQFLDLAQGIGRMHPLGIGRKLPHRFDIGREPGKAVGGALLAVEQTVDHLMIYRDTLAHRDRCVSEQRPDGLRRRACKRDQLSPGVAALSLVQHGELRAVASSARSVDRHPLSLQGPTPKTTRAVHKSNAAEACRGSLLRLCTGVAALLTTWNDIDRLG